MSYNSSVAEPRLPVPLLVIAAASVILGVTFTFTGIAGLFAAIALCMLVVFGALVANFAAPTLGVAIFCLGLAPAYWGLQTTLLPKIFGEEVLLLLYITMFPVLYLCAGRHWRHGFRTLYLVLGIFLLVHALSFVYPTDILSIRSFFETYVLGAILLVLVLQETTNLNAETIARFIVWTTVTIAVLSIVERIFRRNPVMESLNALYVSAEIINITAGVYRPYVSFFLPSEAGTFMAMGAPFAVRALLIKRSWTSILAILVILAALWVNATRGVWVGVVVAAILASRRPVRVILTSVPMLLFAGWILLTVFRSTTFVRRLTDPSDLLYRLEYWKIGARIFAGHPLVGVGHLQFRNTYLQYVTNLSNVITFDISTIFVADNMLLTTAVEHGLLGLIALLIILIYVGYCLRKSRIALSRQGLQAKASLVRCTEIALIVYVVTGFLADVHLFGKATKYLFILLGFGLAQGAGLIDSGKVNIPEVARPALRKQYA